MVKVVDDHHERRVGRERPCARDHGGLEPRVVDRGRVWNRLEVGEPISQARHRREHRGRIATEIGAELVGRHRGGRLDERARQADVGRAQSVVARDADDGRVARRAPRDLEHETGLPDAGLALDEQHLRTAGDGRAQAGEDALLLGFATDERQTRATSTAEGATWAPSYPRPAPVHESGRSSAGPPAHGRVRLRAPR